MTAGIEQSEVDVRGSGGNVDLVRDLLDKQLVDRQHDPMGRADGIVLDVGDGRLPTVLCIESGMTVAAERVSRLLGRFVRGAGRRWGLRQGTPMEIAWRDVARVGIETVLDLEASDTPALAWEHWLRQRVISWLPSLKPAKKEKREGQNIETFAPASQRTGSQHHHRVRLHRILGRPVHDALGQRVGRLEEVKGHIVDGQCVVDEFLLGRGGLMERLSVADLSLVPLRLLGARHAGDGYHVPWQQMDLSDPVRPRMRCTCEELRAMQPAA